MPEDDLIDIKFRLYDGSDIGPFRYSSASTIDVLKQRIVSDWPKEVSFFHWASDLLLFSSAFVFILILLFPFGTIFLYLLGKTITPKAASEVKLISSGKILENNKTVGQCKLPFGEFTGGVTIMHVVVQPSLAKAKTGEARSSLLEGLQIEEEGYL
ncbi:Membrane-anchored ubiquitin-fold protein 3 [Cucurbita argyrosperma subsp. argyrosperma]|nr:Membrane-anchored ubiquitin-fold protein 3 [Cucurbita argyrosperma subsp. argyrosperma]